MESDNVNVNELLVVYASFPFPSRLQDQISFVCAANPFPRLPTNLNVSVNAL